MAAAASAAAMSTPPTALPIMVACVDGVDPPGVAPATALALGVGTAPSAAAMLVTEKPSIGTPARSAIVWNVSARDAPKLAAVPAATEARAACSAATLAAVAASPDVGGRTAASQATSALPRAWRAASPRRDGVCMTTTVIHAGGTPSAAARSATSAAMTASEPAVPTAAAGTETVSVI